MIDNLPLQHKDFSIRNLDYLCNINNTDSETVRKKLNMSIIQFRALDFPKARKKVCDFFSISQDDFLLTDLSIPKKYRYILSLDGEKAFLSNLLNESEKWEITDRSLSKAVDDPFDYAQIFLTYKNDEFCMDINIFTQTSSPIENNCLLLPQWCFAFGYIDFGSGYYRYFYSGREAMDSIFLSFCDQLLAAKHLTIDKWKNTSFIGSNGNFNIGGTITINIDKEHMLIDVYYILLFGKTEKDVYKIKQLSLQILDALKTRGTVDIIPQFFEETMHLQTLLAENKYTESQIIIQLNALLKTIENRDIAKARQKAEEERKQLEIAKFKESVYSEIKSAKKEYGNWHAETHQDFIEHLNNMTFDQFCEQLNNTIKEINNEQLNFSEQSLIKSFIWAKRILTFTRFCPKTKYTDAYNDTYFRDPEDILSFLSFISDCKNNDYPSGYPGFAFMYAKCLLLIQGKNSITIKPIKKLLEKNYSKRLKILLDDLYIIYGIDEQTESPPQKKEFDPLELLSLSNAKWTQFWEETDDSIIEKALPTVYQKVSEVFEENRLALDSFFTGRYIKSRYITFDFPFSDYLYNFGNYIVDTKKPDTMIQDTRYSYTEKGIFMTGWKDEIKVHIGNGRYQVFSLIERKLATYICKYMENHLRKIAKYKTKVSYSYDVSFNIEHFSEDPDIPHELSVEYSKLQILLTSGAIRQAIYNGMDCYIQANPEQMTPFIQTKHLN